MQRGTYRKVGADWGAERGSGSKHPGPGPGAQGAALAVRWTVRVSCHGPSRQEDLSPRLDVADYSSKKAFKFIYFCSYPNQSIKQRSYLFACCSGHQQSYLHPLRSENEALATSQINHKNLLINALNYFQPLTWNPPARAPALNYEIQTVTHQWLSGWGEQWVHVGCLVGQCGCQCTWIQSCSPTENWSN